MRLKSFKKFGNKRFVLQRDITRHGTTLEDYYWEVKQRERDLFEIRQEGLEGCLAPCLDEGEYPHWEYVILYSVNR